MARVIGVVLAGGLSRRMGGEDKALRPLYGRPLIARVIDRLAGQVDRMVINANGDPARHSGLGVPVVADPVGGHLGPLAGVLAALDFAGETAGADALVLSVPADGPFLPLDLAARLVAARDAAGALIACATSGGRVHHTHALWPISLRAALRHALVEDGVRKVAAFVADQSHATVEWPVGPHDPFFNLNTPADWAAAEAVLAADPTL